MEDAWDELGERFQNSKSKLIGEIDCTSDEAQSLCQDMGVNSYPTLKFGDIFDLQEYEGPRDFTSLSKFSDKQLKPTCGVNHVQLCDKATRKEIRRLKKLSLAELDEELFANTESLNAMERNEKEFVAGLEAQYEQATAKKDAEIKEIKDSGLQLMKAVASSRDIQITTPTKKKSASDEL